MGEDPGVGSAEGALEFFIGPAVADGIRAAVALAGSADWLAPAPAPDAARGQGLETTGWLRRRFGLANL